jgi:nicotinamide mononucleotide transporter
MTWLLANWLEVFGFLTAGVCVFLQVREIIWNWPIGIASNVVYFVVFWRSRLYADACLQIFFLTVSIYGWWKWKHGGSSGHEVLAVQRTGRRLAIVLAASTLVALLIIHELLRRFSNSDVPWGDATTTSISLTAQYMLGRKLIENWLLWISVNVLYIGLYCYKRLFLTAFLYAIFIVMCVMGYRGWKQKLDAPEQSELVTA